VRRRGLLVAKFRRLVAWFRPLKPKAMGGDRRSQRIEAQAELILSLWEATKRSIASALRAFGGPSVLILTTISVKCWTVARPKVANTGICPPG
jgi:hypothetical protein